MTILIEKVEAPMAIKRTYSELATQPRLSRPWHSGKSKSSQRLPTIWHERRREARTTS
jgi:hypothetical protein